MSRLNFLAMRWISGSTSNSPDSGFGIGIVGCPMLGYRSLTTEFISFTPRTTTHLRGSGNSGGIGIFSFHKDFQERQQLGPSFQAHPRKIPSQRIWDTLPDWEGSGSGRSQGRRNRLHRRHRENRHPAICVSCHNLCKHSCAITST